MTDLERAKEALTTIDCTCALCRDGEVRTTQLRGVAPLLSWLEEGLSGWSVADRVVGAGAAWLYTLLHPAMVYAPVMSRRAMLPLIVFSVLLGFAANLAGGPDGPVARGLTAVTQVMMQLIRLLTYYAPVAFFAIFAGLVADYGPKIAGAYGRAMAVYYPLCFVYLFTVFPLMARLGGGRGGIGAMLRHIARPALTSLGTCSSVATIPANLEAAEDTGISRDVAEMVIPLGATMHMDGSCFSCVLKIAFVWGVFGQELTWGKLLPIVAVAVLSSVGMSGVPGGGYIGEYIICSLFFPRQMEMAFPILVAIGNLVDPPATMINSSGDYVVSFLVSRFVDGKDWLTRHQKG